MRGKTKFELTDINTGEIKIYENENLVTNAQKDFWNMFINEIAFLMSTSGTTNIEAEILSWFTTGLIMFNDTLTLDADDYFFKDVFKISDYLIGWATTVYSGSDIYRGALNITESDMTSGKILDLVYDFSTDSANGTIDSVALVPKLKMTDLTAYPPATNDELDYMQAEFLLDIAHTGLLLGLSTLYLNALTRDGIIWSYNTTSKIVTKKAYNKAVATEFSILATYDYTALITDASTGIYYDDATDKLYLFRYSSRILYEISKTSTAILNTYDLSSIISASNVNNNIRGACIYNGELYYGDGVASDQRRVYKYNFITSTGPTTIDMSAELNINISTTKYKYFIVRNNKVEINIHNLHSGAYDCIINLNSAGTLVELITTFVDSYSYLFINNKAWGYFTSTGNLAIKPMFATKQNLGTPVTKLNTQTMKVTYTLTWS